jgi:hypothetical protein
MTGVYRKSAVPRTVGFPNWNWPFWRMLGLHLVYATVANCLCASFQSIKQSQRTGIMPHSCSQHQTSWIVNLDLHQWPTVAVNGQKLITADEPPKPPVYSGQDYVCFDRNHVTQSYCKVWLLQDWMIEYKRWPGQCWPMAGFCNFHPCAVHQTARRAHQVPLAWQGEAKQGIAGRSGDSAATGPFLCQ